MILILNISYSIYYYHKVKDFVTAPKTPIKCDACVVFFHNFDDGHLDPETITRLEQGIKIYKDGLAEYIVCVGGAKEKQGRFGAVWMKNYLLAKGVPNGNVFSETSSFDSVSNWKAARNISEREGWKAIALVSSPFHVYRLYHLTKSSDLKIIVMPYSFKKFAKKTGIIRKWKLIQYEQLGYALHKIFPEKIHQGILKTIRSYQK